MFGIFKKARIFATAVYASTLQNASWMSRDAETYAKEGYEQNTIVFRCVEVVAQSIASVPVKLMEVDRAGNRREVPKHDLLALLNRPNLVQTYEDMVFGLVAYSMITGNAYLEALSDITADDNVIPPSANKPSELWVWQPYHFRVQVDGMRPMPRSYTWDKGAEKITWEVDQITGNSQLMHWKNFHPRKKILGLSPIGPAANSIDQHNEAGEWNKKLLENNAQPPGALVYQERLTREEYNRTKAEMKETFSGPRNARMPILLEGGADYKTLAINPTDMDWLEGKKVSAQEIAAAFGVPLQVIPIDGSQTFANYEQARLALWEDTVIPKLERLLNLLELFLFPKFGLESSSYRLEPDLDKIPALASRRKQKWETANESNFLSTNEKRDLVGYEKRKEPEADEILIPGNLLPLSISSGSSSSPITEPEDEEDDDEDTNLLGGADDKLT